MRSATSTRRRASRLLAVFVVVGLLASACSKKDSKDDAGAGGRAAPTSPQPTGPPNLQFTVTEVNANGTAAPDEATVAAVKKTLDGWLASAVVAPLHSGQSAPDLSPLFTPLAFERVVDPVVRPTLIAEGLPPATTSITAEVANVQLSSVAGPDGVVALVGARVDVKLHVVGPTLDADVIHQGEFVLGPEADGWRIGSFAMHTARDSRT